MICYLRYFVLFLLSVFLTISPLMQVVSLADINDLMIATDSNALMTLSDYDVSVTSALGSVTNTVDLSQVVVGIYVTNGSNGYYIYKEPTISNNKLNVKLLESDILDGYHIWLIRITLKNDSGSALPKYGVYNFKFDLSNEFNFEYRNAYIDTKNFYLNASTFNDSFDLTSYCTFENGEAYCSGVNVDLGSVDVFQVSLIIDESYSNIVNFDSDMSFSFTKTSASSDFNIGSSVSDIDVSEEISSSVDEIVYSTNSIFDSLQELIQHISNQLAALWDQMYNYMHVPHMAKLDEVIDAISNIDIEFQIDFDELKTSINNMSTAVQNKLQSTTDQITGGYDNSGMNQDQQLLDDTLNQYEEVENEVISDAKENISGFEFKDGLSEFAGPLEDISYFLGAIFTGLGAMNVIISFSLTLTIAMCMIGWYRFKGGK